ncbi:MAG: hypothetical protein IJ733_00800 [Lachnospiraceae bacterium]|nr:hypothetical protein [Lachnospiraceae bacterium]
MPFIISRVNIPITKSQETELKKRMGKAIEYVPGKSENYLMTGFEDNYHLYLRGDDSEPVAYVEVSIFGNEDHIGYDRLTVEITRMFHDILKIASDHVYVRYVDIGVWGVAGMTYDRRQYD